jgi:hypothetical protein
LRERGPLEHLYGSARWKRIRAYVLRIHPLCKFCLDWGIVTPATTVDHIEPHRGDINKFWCHEDGLQSLCHQCHVSTKYFIELHGYNPTIGLDGWPVDKRHPIYRGLQK